MQMNCLLNGSWCAIYMNLIIKFQFRGKCFLVKSCSLKIILTLLPLSDITGCASQDSVRGPCGFQTAFKHFPRISQCF